MNNLQKKYRVIISLVVFFHLGSEAFQEALSLPSEVTNLRFGQFLFPNESHHFHYRSVIDREPGNALLTVGSFRALSIASLGNFSRVIVLDYDELVTEMMQALLPLITGLKKTGWSQEVQRIQFVALIHGLFLYQCDIDRLFKAYPTDCERHQQLLANHQELPELDLALLPSYLQNSVQLVHKAIDARSYTNFTPIEKTSEGLWEVKKEQLASFWVFGCSPEIFAGAFWGSNEAWGKIQTMIEENRISIITASFFGEETLPALGRIMKENGEKLSVIELSNVAEHIDCYFKEAGFKGFIYNLYLLPYTDGAQLLTTTSTIGQDFRWTYQTIKIADFLNYFEQCIVGRYSKLHEKIVTWSTILNPETGTSTAP